MRERNDSWMDRFNRFCTDHRPVVLGVILLAALAFGSGIPRIRGEVIIEELLPYAHPYLKIMADFSDVFGSGGSFVAVGLEARDGNIYKQGVLRKIQAIDQEVSLWEEVYRVLTVSIASRTTKVVKPVGEGEIKVEPLMWPNLPGTPDELADLKRNILSDPNLRGILVSRDGRAAMIMTQFKENISYEHAFDLLQELDRRYTDEETRVHLVGFPVLMGWIYSYKAQIVLVMGMSVGLIVLVLFFSFQNLMGMVVPLSFGLVSSAIGLGFIGWTGINFSPLLYVLAFLVVARMVSHSVQITHRYMELYVERQDRVEACFDTMQSMIIPNWAAVSTEVAGFLVLILVKIVLMQYVAIFMTVWMMTIALCGIFTPILCSYMPLARASESWVRRSARQSWLDRLCVGASNFSTGRGKAVIIAGVAALVGLFAHAAPRLKIGDPSPGTPLLWPEHRYNQDQAMVDRTFDVSSEDFTLYFAGDAGSIYDDPAILKTFEAFDRHMQNQLPDIYKSSDSILGLMKTIHFILHDGDMVWRELPNDPDSLTNLIGWTRDQVDAYSMGRYFDPAMSKGQITLYFSDHTTDNLLSIHEAAKEFFAQHPMKLEKGEFLLAGGRIGMEMATNEEMKRTHLQVDAMVLLSIFLLCLLFYRSFVGALMFTLPLVLANMMAYGYMAMAGIGLTINTLPVAAVGVGVGVDFAIYIYNRCREEAALLIPHGQTPTFEQWIAVIRRAVRTSGKAVILTGLTVVLPISAWYFVSDMKFQAQVGLFLALILSANVLFAITLHPLMLYLIRPKFIVRHGSGDRGAGRKGSDLCQGEHRAAEM
ncbi:MAG: MMPL family transporter [bacterium]